MTFNELHNKIVDVLFESGMPAQEIYGVIATIEAEVRFELLGTIRSLKEQKNDRKDNPST